jgi:hypothetical protein
MASIADQFLQYGQLRAQQSQNLGQSIGDTIDLAMKMRAQREANLEEARRKEAERMAKQQENAMEPETILAKALQFGPESLTPQERATFEASQQIQGAKIVYDQFGQPRAGYTPITLSATAPATGIAATPLMPQAPQVQAEELPPLAAAPRGAMGVLMPPPVKGQQPSRADFERFMAGGTLPQPEGTTLPPPTMAQEPTSVGVVKTAEQRLRDMGITKPVKPERLDFATAKQYEADLAAYNDALNQAREAAFAEKKVSAEERKAAPAIIKDLESSINIVDRAIQQSNKLNTGFIGGRTILGVNPNPFAADLQATLGTVQARTALDSLVQAKERGATFGALSDAELQLLKDRTAALDRTQSPQQLDDNLRLIKEQYQNILSKVRAASGMTPPSSEIETKLRAAGFSPEQIREYKLVKGIK